MLTIYFIILCFVFAGVSFHRKGFYDGYVSIEQSNCIKGIFIIFVFARHIWPYMSKIGYDFSFYGDLLFRKIDGVLGQLIVVMFLFYSGFGVMESYKKKGKSYIDSIPKKRILTTLLNFDVAILFFLLLDILLDIRYPSKEIALAFTGWTSIGNSNWYIFVILFCYLSTFVASHFKTNVVMTNFMFVGIVYIILGFTKPSYWYDTIFVYPLGIAYSFYKGKIENVCKKNYLIFMLLTFVVLIVCFFIPYSKFGILGNIRAILFSMIFVLLSMKFKLHNSILEWLGKNLFPLYIYQRIGMILFANIYGGVIICDYPFLYVVMCLILTVIFAWGYRFIQIKLC